MDTFSPFESVAGRTPAPQTNVALDRELLGSATTWPGAKPPHVSQMAAQRRSGALPRPMLTSEVRLELDRWLRAGSTPQRLVRRARVVLLAAEGRSNRAIARTLHISQRTAALWRLRFSRGGVASLTVDAPGRGRKVTATTAAAGNRVLATLAMRPPGVRWSVRTLAHACGMSRASVHRLLRAAGRSTSDANSVTVADRSSEASGASLADAERVVPTPGR